MPPNIISKAVRDYFGADEVSAQWSRIEKALKEKRYNGLDAVDRHIVQTIKENLKDENYVKTLQNAKKAAKG